MRPLSTSMLILVVVVLAGSGCTGQRVRAQSLFFYLHHAVLFVADDGRGAYTVEIQSIREVPELSTLHVEMERPGKKPWTHDITVGAGQRRWQIQSPVFEGFEPDGRYRFRLRLIGPDKFTILDRLHQSIEPSAPGDASGS